MKAVWKVLFPGWDVAQGRRLLSLDGWRALGTAAVMMGHGIPKDSPLAPLRLLGMPAVYVFFAISGFLITSRFLDEEERKGQIDLRAFYLRRALRIFPAAYAFLSVLWVLGAVGLFQPMPLRELLADAFFLQDYVGSFPGRTHNTGHFWSLAIEEKFYMLFPLLFVLGASVRLRGLLFLCMLAPAWRLLDESVVQLQDVFPGIFPIYRLDWLFDVLLWGSFAAVMVRNERVRHFLCRGLRLPVWIALAGLLVWVMWKRPPLFITLGGILATLLILGTVLQPESRVTKLLEWTPLRVAGQLSYGIYLWQQLFFVGSVLSPHWYQRFPLNVIFTLALALLSFHFVEQPFIVLWDRLKARRKVQPRVSLGE